MTGKENGGLVGSPHAANALPGARGAAASGRQDAALDCARSRMRSVQQGWKARQGWVISGHQKETAASRPPFNK
jgi:hypothetical protein